MDRNRKTKEILSCLLMVAGVIAVAARDAQADFTFGKPENLGPSVNGSLNEAIHFLSADGLSLYVGQWTPDFSKVEAWVLITRATRDDPWGAPVTLEFPPSTPEIFPSLTTADGLELYYPAEQPGGYGSTDLCVTTRETVNANWEPGVNLGPVVNSAAEEHATAISPDGLELYFAAYNRSGGYGHYDLWVTRRATREALWTEPENLGPAINSAYQDGHPHISSNGLLLFFDSQRPGGYGRGDVYVTRRATLADPWGTPVNLGPIVNSPSLEICANTSPDGSRLSFSCDRPGGHGRFDIWETPIIPIVDFNGDGISDLVDLVMLIDNWGTDSTLCDIGPMPWGDGVVDIEDLKVFIRYWEKENTANSEGPE